MNKNGKLIVIDGGDGSGKATQTKLLIEYLQNNGHKAKSISFPQYNKFYGSLIGQALKGEFGDFINISPYIVSPLYACDRLSAKQEMDEWLNSGGHLVLDRYTTSNMGHQGGKFKTQKERDTYLDWLLEMEYKINKLPKEDLVIYLHVNRETARELNSRETDKNYGNGQKDYSEIDPNYQLNSEQMFLYLVEKYDHWKQIKCMNDNALLSIPQIHSMIINLVKENNIIPQTT